MTAPIPQVLALADLPDESLVRAFLQIDNGALRNMDINTITGEASTSIPALAPGEYTVVILFDYQSPEFGTVPLASATRPATVQAGQSTNLSFSNDDYVFPDGDQDGSSNFDEISNGTDPADANSPEQIVFTRRTSDLLGNETLQIYRMNALGDNVINLSDSPLDESSPDVRHDGQQIVFTASGPVGLLTTLYTINVDGTGRLAIPGTPVAERPKWSREAPYTIIYVAPDEFFNTSAIWSVAPNGTEQVQLSSPDEEEADDHPDVVGNEFMVFSREDLDDGSHDLYLQRMKPGESAFALTNTSNESEDLPTVSHDGSLLAYLVVDEQDLSEEVRVATFDLNGNLGVVETIVLAPPAVGNITGIAFSANDAHIYIAADAIAPATVAESEEIFRVNRDGNNQIRLTDNEDSDFYPSAIPQAIAQPPSPPLPAAPRL